MKKILIVIAVTLMASLILSACQGATGPAGPAGPAGPVGSAGSAGKVEPTVQNFSIALGEGKVIGEVGEKDEITGEFHRWEPSVLVVNKNDTVILNVTNPRSKVHSFLLPDFGVATPGMEPRGGTATVEFVADKAGVFQYSCGIPFDRDAGALDCNLDHKRQVGYLIVLER